MRFFILATLLSLPLTGTYAQDVPEPERADIRALELEMTTPAEPEMNPPVDGAALAVENENGDLRLWLGGSGALIAPGTYVGAAGIVPVSGDGVRLMWIPERAAFRAGRAWTEQAWDPANMGNYSTAFGFGTTASGGVSTAMGAGTTASGAYSTAMGEQTTANGTRSMAMGYFTTASGDFSTAMGAGPTASGYISTAMGSQTTASGLFSTAMGERTTASGGYSTAMGSYASTDNRTGSFVYGDASTTNVVLAGANNQFVVRAAGGFLFRTSSNLTTGCNLAAGSGTWNCTSSRDEKMDFQDLDGEDVLARVAGIPVQSWRYINEEGEVRHVGPTSQDFRAAFGLGSSDEAIGHIDASGINMRAIQALEVRTRDVQDQTSRIDLLERENADLRERLTALEAALASGGPSIAAAND